MKASLRHILTPPIPPVRHSTPPPLSSTASGSVSPTAAASAALASSLSLSTASPASTPSSRTSSSASSPDRVHLLAVHPTLPHVAFVTSPASVPSSSGGAAPGSISFQQQQDGAYRQIVVQDYVRNATIRSITVADVAACLYEFDLSAPDGIRKQAAAVKALGQIRNLSFFDRHTLHWTSGGHANVNNNNNNNNDQPSQSSSSGQGGHGGGTTSSSPSASLTLSFPPPRALLIQFESRVVVLNLRLGPYTQSVDPNRRISCASSTRRVNPYRPILSSVTPSELQRTDPTSLPLPLTPSILAVGCSDGTIRFIDMHGNKIIKSVRGPNGRSDPVVKLVDVNPYPTAASSSSSPSNATPLEDELYSIKSRVVCVCQSNNAYLWELVVTTSPTTGGIEKFRIRPPLARMSGVGIEKKDGTASSSGGGAGGGGGGGDGGKGGNSPADESALVTYDPDRDLLLWHIPSGYNGSSKAHVVVWDMNNVPQPPKNKSMAIPPANVAPRHEPFLVVQVPNAAFVDHCVCVGSLHPCFPETALVCVLGTKSGDLVVVGCSVDPSMDGNKAAGGGAGGGKASAGADRGVTKGVTYYQTALSSLRKNAGGGGGGSGGDGKTGSSNSVKIFSVASSRFDPTTLLVGTNLGIMVVQLDEWANLPPGTRHAPIDHSGGILLVENSAVFSAQLDVRGMNPTGRVEVKNPTLVYKSPPALHLPLEIRDRPVRLPPRLILSPSGSYLCLFWQAEARYEILHLGSILRGVAKGGGLGVGGVGVGGGVGESQFSPAVDTGSGVRSFAWVGDEDVFALLHPPALAKRDKESGAGGSGSGGLSSRESVLSPGPPGSSSTGATGGGKKSLRKQIVKMVKSPTPVASAGVGSSHGGVSMSTSLSTGIKPSLSMGGLADEDVTPLTDPSKFQPRVELKVLIAVNANAAEISGSIAAATATILGDVQLRGGNQNPPTALFGGPVLCVGSRPQGNSSGGGGGDVVDSTTTVTDGGMAYFYTRRPTVDENDNRASTYTAVGPPLPHPDLVAWDDDGRLCALIVGSTVAIYLSDPPNFTLLGTARLGSPTEVDVKAESAKFLHGVLYVSSRTAVQCIFLGDLENEDNVCHVDSFVLASADVPPQSSRLSNAAASTSNHGGWVDSSATSFAPSPKPMALNRPSVLAYHSGSLLVSTVSGVQSVSLNHPLLRIGTLLAAGQTVRAQRWFDAVNDHDHEALATFLDRRGCPELAVQLPGLSLETIVDFCLRYGLTERLENVIDTYGLDGIRKIDRGRGVVSSSSMENDPTGHSVVVCVGAYLLSQGKAELVRRLATECMVSGEEGRREAFVLASLLLAVDASDARRLVRRAVGGSMKGGSSGKGFGSGVGTPGSAAAASSSGVDGSSAWPVGTYVRDHVL